MQSYNQFLNSEQEFACVDENLILTELCPAREVLEFISSAPIEPDLIEAKWTAIDAYESGALGAIETLRYLEAIGAFADADELARIYCAGARAYLGVPIPPETFPTSPGMRSEPSRELLEAIAGRAA
jgi:hypothetical protein